MINVLPGFDSFTVIEVWGTVLLAGISLSIFMGASPFIRQQVKRSLLSVVLVSVLLSSLSAIASDRYPSGTMMRTVRGYPRTFYSSWQDLFDPRFVGSGFSAFRFFENSLVYVSWLSFILLFYWIVLQIVREFTR